MEAVGGVGEKGPSRKWRAYRFSVAVGPPKTEVLCKSKFSARGDGSVLLLLQTVGGRMADYPNPDRRAGLMRAFDTALKCKAQAHLMSEQLAKAATEQMEALAQTSPDDPPVYVPRQGNPRRTLNPFSFFVTSGTTSGFTSTTTHGLRTT